MTLTPTATTPYPLFERYPALTQTLPRVTLSDGPSPVSRLEAISRGSGQEVWIKNDGLYGTLYGGNKPRKLELVLPRAMATGARTVMTTGPLGTHHGLATALLGRELGLKVALLLTYQQPNAHIIRQLCRMQKAGAELHYVRSGPGIVLMAPYLALKYTGRDRGRRPYLLPPGGSTPLGALGYVNAAFELAEQVKAGELPEPASIVLPVGTGGTAAGLALGLGLAGLQTKIVGVAITRAPTTWALTVRRLAAETAGVMRRNGVRDLPSRLAGVKVFGRWLGGGYGLATRESQEALQLMAAEEGVLLEPTYTAKTVAGLLSMCAGGDLRGPILYWHTYDARLAGEADFGPADYAALPREFRRFCPAA
ncbi:MAG TPA: pyridoxal-phosphate dependent enzyme [Dehalococcoidia bacterium]|nr:pyridoxal-phosphate dependent enzyme [Dehalococcoidia bacterium]